MSATPFVLTDNQQVTYGLSAEDAKLNPAQLAAGATLAVTSADPASVAVVPDATPAAGTVASGLLVAGAKLTASVQISAAVTNADGSAGPTGTQAIAVVADAASTIAFTLGTATAQPPSEKK